MGLATILSVNEFVINMRDCYEYHTNNAFYYAYDGNFSGRGCGNVSAYRVEPDEIYTISVWTDHVLFDAIDDVMSVFVCVYECHINSFFPLSLYDCVSVNGSLCNRMAFVNIDAASEFL